MYRTLCFVAILALWCSSPAAAWPPPINGGWQDVSTEVFPSGVGYSVRPSAVVDWNNDRYVDLVCIGNDAVHGNVVSIWEWSCANNSFVLGFESPPLSAGDGSTTVANVVSADFNRDGANDLVVLMTNGDLWTISGFDNNVTQIPVALPDGDVLSGSTPQLSVVSVFGLCALPDLVVTSTSNNLYVLRNDLGLSATDCSFLGGALFFTPVRVATSVAPLSILAADISGTCNAVLVYATVDVGAMLSTYYWYDSVRLTSTKLFSVPSYAGVPSVVDANVDGAVDFAFPYCLVADSSCQNGMTDYTALLFVYARVAGSICASYDCCAGFSLTYSDVPVASSGGVGYDVVSVADQPGCSTLTTITRELTTNAGTVRMPSALRAADFNRDSYEDLGLATNAGPVLLARANGASSPPQFSCTAVASVDSSGDLLAVPFFFDLNEDGRLDLILIHPDASVSGVMEVGMSAIWNGLVLNEAYFLTALVLNGVNVNRAPAASLVPPGVGFPAFDTAQVGAVHRFQWQDIETNLRTASSAQSSATQAHALQSIRVHFGLGRTFSYIQNYAVGIHFMSFGNSGSASSSVHYTWPSYLIPNSQVVAIPYPLDQPAQWQLKLFLSNSAFKTLLLIALGTALVVIGVPIVALKVREMKEDMAESKLAA